MLDHERAQRIRLEQTVEDLAKQHNFLEEACRERVVPKHKSTEKIQRPNMTVGSPTIQQPNDAVHESSDDDCEFFDAIAEEPEDILDSLVPFPESSSSTSEVIIPKLSSCFFSLFLFYSFVYHCL